MTAVARVTNPHPKLYGSAFIRGVHPLDSSKQYSNMSSGVYYNMWKFPLRKHSSEGNLLNVSSEGNGSSQQVKLNSLVL